MKIERINLGEIIREKVSQSGMTNAAFARKIGLARQNVNKTVFEKMSLDTNLLITVSEVLECNLFDYFKSDADEKKTELKATITIELGKEKKDKSFRIVFGENELKL